MTRVIINQSWLIAVDVKSINFRDYKKSHDHDREYHGPRIAGGRAGPRVRGPRCCTSHWEARGFQALQWRAPESEQERAVPRRGASVVGCQPWLIWRLYVYYDTRGRNTSSSLLTNRSEKSAKPSRLRGAPHQVKRESRVPTRKIVLLFFFFFFKSEIYFIVRPVLSLHACDA